MDVKRAIEIVSVAQVWAKQQNIQGDDFQQVMDFIRSLATALKKAEGKAETWEMRYQALYKAGKQITENADKEVAISQARLYSIERLLQVWAIEEKVGDDKHCRICGANVPWDYSADTIQHAADCPMSAFSILDSLTETNARGPQH